VSGGGAVGGGFRLAAGIGDVRTDVALLRLDQHDAGLDAQRVGKELVADPETVDPRAALRVLPERAGPVGSVRKTSTNFSSCSYLLFVATERAAREDAATNLRVAVNNAYGFLKGAEATTTFQSVTFEEMVQRQTDRLEGKNGSGRSEIERITKFRDDLVGAIGAIKNTPQDQFYSQESNDAQGVNTKSKK